MKKKLYMETYGCQMNVHDSEKAVFSLSQCDFEPTDDPFSADLVLLNTCMVREKAARKVEARISDLRGQIQHARHAQQVQLESKDRSRRGLPIFGVMGCVAQAEADRLFDRCPDVRLVLGTQAIGRLPELVGQLEDGFERAIEVRLSKDADFFELQAGVRQTKHVAFVTITEGCNKFCSYCIVPFTRGRERSRRADNIVQEVRDLAERGYHEVQLLGQNVNSYGASGHKPGGRVPLGLTGEAEISFAKLLERVALEGGVPRVKYTTSYPRDFDADIVRVMDAHQNLCEWIHLPAQSGSDRILRAMRRGYDRLDYMRRIESIRAGRKDYSITGDIIIGFPGESEQDFQQTLELVAEVGYDGLFIFNYSPRPHTPAAAYADSVPDEVKSDRFNRLLELQRRIQEGRYARYLDRQVEVLVEGTSARSPLDLTGHTRCQKVINFPGAPALIGRVVRVMVTGAKQNSLYGRLVEPIESSPSTRELLEVS